MFPSIRCSHLGCCLKKKIIQDLDDPKQEHPGTIRCPGADTLSYL
jgi:Rieske Fe-S protein